MVLPGTGMSFEQFRQDDALCRQYAAEQVGQTPEGASDSSGLRSAAVGTAVGAVAGALIDGRRGAGVGAGTGLVVGSAAGAGSAQVSGREAQRRYDNAFVQCMYARGTACRCPATMRRSGRAHRRRRPCRRIRRQTNRRRRRRADQAAAARAASRGDWL